MWSGCLNHSLRKWFFSPSPFQVWQEKFYDYPLSYDLPIFQGLQNTENNSYGNKRISYLSGDLFFLNSFFFAFSFYKKIMTPLPWFSKNVNLWIREKFIWSSSSSLLSLFDHLPWWTWLLLLTISSIIAIPQVILFFVHLFFATFLALFCSNFWIFCLLRHLCFLGKMFETISTIFFCGSLDSIHIF